MTLGDGVKAAALLFVAAVFQVSVFSQVHVFGAVPDVMLVTFDELVHERLGYAEPPKIACSTRRRLRVSV